MEKELRLFSKNQPLQSFAAFIMEAEGGARFSFGEVKDEFAHRPSAAGVAEDLIGFVFAKGGWPRTAAEGSHLELMNLLPVRAGNGKASCSVSVPGEQHHLALFFRINELKNLFAPFLIPGAPAVLPVRNLVTPCLLYTSPSPRDRG